VGAKAVDDVEGAADCRGLPAGSLGQFMHHDIGLAVGRSRCQVASAGDAGAAEEVHSSPHRPLNFISWR
jgi:hypothetical protein